MTIRNIIRKWLVAREDYEYVDIISDDLSSVVMDGSFDFEELEKEIKELIDRPMGVSQWKEYGKKYGYWDYFRKELIEEIIPEENKPKLGSENQDEYVAYANGYNDCIKYIKSKLYE